MGSWSVYCGISNIAITSGNKCVLLPLKKCTSSEDRQWQPATLPIFGEYNDYGGIENIEENDSTKLIEEHFGITIDEFATFLVDGKFTYEREEAEEVVKKMKNHKEAAEWRFMWIDRLVYDFMITDQDEYSRGYNNYGTPEMLKNFGFKQIKGAKISNYDPQRFNQLWHKDDVEFYSDGRTLLSKKGNYVYHYGHNDDTSLETYFNVPKKYHHLKNLNKTDTWKFLPYKEAIQLLGSVLGNRYEFDYLELDELIAEMNKKVKEHTGKDHPKSSISLPLHRKYYDDLNTFGDQIAQMWHLIKNIRPMSGELKPMSLYVTPQCGEYKKHQVLLEKFAEINKFYLKEKGYEDED